MHPRQSMTPQGHDAGLPEGGGCRKEGFGGPVLVVVVSACFFRSVAIGQYEVLCPL